MRGSLAPITRLQLLLPHTLQVGLGGVLELVVHSVEGAARSLGRAVDTLAGERCHPAIQRGFATIERLLPSASARLRGKRRNAALAPGLLAFRFMLRNQPPSPPSNESGRQPPGEDVAPFDLDTREPPPDDARAGTTRDLGHEEDEALAEADIMKILDLDDLTQMDGPDA